MKSNMILNVDKDLIMVIGAPTRYHKSRYMGMETYTSRKR